MNRVRTAVLRELSIPECLEVLATSSVGRLAITQNALPALLPVRLRLANGYVLISSLVGTSIPLVARGVAALEVGNLGEGHASEWTVEVCGFLRDDTQEKLDPDDQTVATFTMSTTNIRGWGTPGTTPPLP
jgi:hypothetical protein